MTKQIVGVSIDFPVCVCPVGTIGCLMVIQDEDGTYRGSTGTSGGLVGYDLYKAVQRLAFEVMESLTTDGQNRIREKREELKRCV